MSLVIRPSRTTASGAKRASTAGRSWAFQAAVYAARHRDRVRRLGVQGPRRREPPATTGDRQGQQHPPAAAASPQPAPRVGHAGAPYRPGDRTSTRRVTWPVLSQ